MQRVLAACLVTMTACAIDPSPEPGDLPPENKPVGSERDLDTTVDASRFLARSINCVKQMRVSGVGPYSVQCAVGYFATVNGVQLAFTATDANDTTWVASHAAAPRSLDDSDGFVIFALESPGAPAMGSLTVRAHLVDDALGTSNELTETVVVSP